MMLNSLRSGAAGFLVYIMLGLLVVSFSIWGVGDVFTQRGGANIIARVGSQDIPTPVFERQYRDEMERVRQLLGKHATPEAIANLGLAPRILDKLVVNELLRQETIALHLLPDDETVASEIRRDSTFQNDKGVFDKAIFKNVLSHSGVREADYVDDVRLRLGRDILSRTLTAVSPVDDSMAAGLFAAMHEMRVADVIMIPPALIPLPEAPSDEQLESFYQAQASLFMMPELRTLSYLIIPKEKIADENGDKAFATLSAKIQDALAGGSTIPEVASSLGLAYKTLPPLDQQGNAANGTPVKEVPAYPEFMENAFTIEEGSQSQLVRMDNGYYLLQVDKVQVSKPQPFADVRPKLAAAWQAMERQKRLHTEADKVAGELAQAKDDAGQRAVLAEHKLQMASSGRIGHDTQHTPGGLMLPPELLKDIFARPVGQATGAFSAKEGTYYIAIIRERIPAPPAKETELEDFKDKLAKMTREDMLTAFLEHLRSKYPVTIRQQVLNSYGAQAE